MRALPSSLRKQLETSVLAARRAAEAASRAAIESLGVFADRRPEHLDSAQAALRNGLRAKWRQLGNDRDLLVAECAYEQWHRLLFARFLAENGLLLHPQFRAPVTLADCEELAADLGEPDAWSVAARFAAEILPGIFRRDDPCVRLRLAPEGRHALEQILDGIPAETFAADDALGWVYQFWQKEKKDEVNGSERKIGGADLAPVTQLFTENYMVRFLLENSLGAWWAARHPDSPLVKGLEYLRFDDGKPAAGTFEGWPDRVAEVTVMDPCCGSGHFLVEAFSMLWQMRAEEGGLAPVEAQDAVLRDNLFGLELDLRCVQIAMFNVALQAWKVGGGWRQLPVPNIACSGVPVKAPVEEWKALAQGDDRLENALVRLHILFRDADTLGSLIDPRRTIELSDPTARQRSLHDVDWAEVEPTVRRVLKEEIPDPALAVIGADAAGVARAALYLSRTYTLIATNVPYLLRGHQSPILRSFLETHFPRSDADLATAFYERVSKGLASTCALVLPQSWTSLRSYRDLRTDVLQTQTFAAIARLGAGAFAGISGEIVQVVLQISLTWPPADDWAVAAIDTAGEASPARISSALREGELLYFRQADQLKNAEARIVFEELHRLPPLGELADIAIGLHVGDDVRFRRQFWELASTERWERFQLAGDVTGVVGGLDSLIWWPDGGRVHRENPNARVQGDRAWGRTGIAIRLVRPHPVSPYWGALFGQNIAAVIPYAVEHLDAIWYFLQSAEFRKHVAAIDGSLKVTPRVFASVPFDVNRWSETAHGGDPFPAPRSAEPTQWLFEGRPEASTASLQVAVARLVGYRWPDQPESDDLDLFADADGIVCLPAVAGEQPAADRVQQLIAAAFGDSWTPTRVKELLEQAGSKKKNLADWLRDEFFKQHCSLFENRPFVWHIWDGQRDGFSALVNYHRLDRKTLEKLTYTYLGQDWVERQRAERRDGVAGAEARLAAALGLQKKLEAIHEGEAPLDIYVRWKEIREQPIGWEPDLNEGVRLNIRPFVEAGVLRSPFNIHWSKDRGKNPDGTERLNDVHLTLAEKLETRKGVDRA
jgi:hypothetical protein